jgi:hypothetical protein
MNRFSKMSLIALALGAFAFLHGCYSPSVNLPQAAVAYIYENGGVKKTVRFTAENPAPTELQEWVKFNNGTWYRPTITNYVPKYVVNFPDISRGFTFYTKSVQVGTFVHDMTDEDRAFLNWLDTQPGETRCPDCSDSWPGSSCSRCGGKGVVPIP